MQLATFSEKVRGDLATRPLLTVFDRDGTIVPFANLPHEAVLEDSTRSLLSELSACPHVRVVVLSARNADHLKVEFDNDRLILAGNYGLEIIGPHARHFVHPRALACMDMIAAVREYLDQIDLADSGIILDDHSISLCLHHHLADRHARENLFRVALQLETEYPQLAFRKLETSLEILPDLPWTKATALEHIVSELWTEGHKEQANQEWLYLCAGDSPADWPVFEWVNERGGISISVGPERNGAQYLAPTPDALLALVADIVELRKNRRL